MPIAMHPRDRVIANLKAHADVDLAKIEHLQNICVVLEYFSRPNHRGGAMSVMANPEKRELSGGKTVTWKDVPLDKVLKNVESFIKTDVEEAKRSTVWHRIFDGLPMRKRPASWEKPVTNPNEHPESPYSASRAEEPKSNQQLVEALVSVAGVDAMEAHNLGANIAFADSWNGKNSGALSISKGVFTVFGGRLGRDHTLGDVPNHYVRDRLMDYVQTELPEEAREKAQKAVFDDLGDTDLQSYANWIKEKREREDKADRLYENEGSKLKNRGEAKNVLKLEQALETIDCDETDLGPKRDRYGMEYDEVAVPLAGSCVRPNQMPTRVEKDLRIIRRIDKDCDQVRAMIARLVKYSDEGWTLDSFRRALGRTDRAKLIDFLQRQGQDAGEKMQLHGKAWEFFHRRALLGIPLPGPPETESTAGGNKRKREPLEERAVNVIERTVQERQEGYRARKVAKDYEGDLTEQEVISKVLAGERRSEKAAETDQPDLRSA